MFQVLGFKDYEEGIQYKVSLADTWVNFKKRREMHLFLLLYWQKTQPISYRNFMNTLAKSIEIDNDNFLKIFCKECSVMSHLAFDLCSY